MVLGTLDFLLQKFGARVWDGSGVGYQNEESSGIGELGRDYCASDVRGCGNETACGVFITWWGNCLRWLEHCRD